MIWGAGELLFPVGVDLIWDCNWGVVGGVLLLGVWGGAWAGLFVCWVCGLVCGLVCGRVDYGAID